MDERATNPKSAIHALPVWARYLAVVLVIVAIPVCIINDLPRGVWVLVGPIILIHMWTGEELASQSRADKPVVFWAIFSVFAALTAWGVWELAQKLIGAIQ